MILSYSLGFIKNTSCDFSKFPLESGGLGRMSQAANKIFKRGRNFATHAYFRSR
jgi:hypothetical protein